MTQNPVKILHVPILSKPERLDKFLIETFPKTSRSYWRRLLPQCVRINGKASRKGQVLKGGETIEIGNNPREGKPSLQADPSFKVRVIYQDRQLIAVDKPPGIPCHPLRSEERGTVANALAAQYPELKNFSQNPLEGGLLHRLDNDTSGVLLFCRNEKSLKSFRALNQAEGIDKYYLAVVRGTTRARGIVAESIAHHPKNKKKMRIPKDAKEAKGLNARPAMTEYRRIKSGVGLSLLLLRIKKGARHQIRIHLAAIGHPIVGDALYAAKPAPEEDVKLSPERHLLHARKVELVHPLSREKLAITAPLPKDFQKVLKKYF